MDAYFAPMAGGVLIGLSASLLMLLNGRIAGISGIVDPYGRITTSLALGTEGIIDAPLPAALARPTPYAQWGDGSFWLLILLNLAIGLTMSRRTA